MFRKFNLSSKAIFSIAFVFIVGLASVENAAAQRRFEPKSVGAETELKSLAQFTQNLADFVKQAQYIEQENNASEPELKKLRDIGRRIKDGTSNTRGNLQGLISKLKSNNQWNEEFDQSFVNAITSPRIKAFINRLGGARKALTEAEAAANSLSQDVDATISDAQKGRAENFRNDDVFFVKASFAPANRAAGKVRLKCVLLGVGVAAAEITKLKLTAENLDNLFDSNKCGSAGAPTT